MAWREAEAAVEKGLKRTSAGLPEEAIDDPLRAEVGQNLARTWKLNYNFDVPSAWQGTPNLLGRFHRVPQAVARLLLHQEAQGPRGIYGRVPLHPRGFASPTTSSSRTACPTTTPLR